MNHKKGSALNINDFTNKHPVDRAAVERHKERMIKYNSFVRRVWGDPQEWGELTFAWTPTKTATGWVWLRRIWKIHSSGRTHYEKVVRS